MVLYPFYLLSNPEGNLYSSGKTWAAGHKAVILLIAYTNNIFNHIYVLKILFLNVELINLFV